MSHVSKFNTTDEAALSRDSGGILLVQVQQVLVFLKEELEGSTSMLSRFAEELNSEICLLNERCNSENMESSIDRMSETLQAEDRIRQRLIDIASALRVVEQVMASPSEEEFSRLPTIIIGELRLGEMQNALAVKADMREIFASSSAPIAPSLGDVDLF